mgnify:FL=1
MMNVSVICVGKLKESYLKDGCAEYIKRLSAFAKVNVVEVAEERCGDSPSAGEIEKVLQKEGERIIAKIPKGAAVVPLCIEGSEFSSPQLAKQIAQTGMRNSALAFVIGGSFGLSPQVKQLGRIKLSFGKMTLPHQLARLVLLEQIYRAFSINNNSKYHK